VTIRSAIAYTVASFAGWVAAAAWYAYHHNGRWGDLGWAGAVAGGVFFTLLFAAGTFAYARVSRLVHRDELPMDAVVLSAVAGLAFWPIALPLHEYLRDTLRFPDAIWYPELLFIGACISEAVRAVALRLRVVAPN
jgi:hypothetical protein